MQALVNYYLQVLASNLKQIFDRIKTEKRYTVEEMCLTVAMKFVIRVLGGNIKKTTVRGLYERNIKNNGYISTLDRLVCG